jgi:hypothetical protein
MSYRALIGFLSPSVPYTIVYKALVLRARGSLGSFLLPYPFFFSCGDFLTCSMRLFKLISLLGLFFWARASSLKTREPASHPLDARELPDVCALVNEYLAVPLQSGYKDSVGFLCQSFP